MYEEQQSVREGESLRVKDFYHFSKKVKVKDMIELRA